MSRAAGSISSMHRSDRVVLGLLALLVALVPVSLFVARMKQGRGPAALTSGPAPSFSLPAFGGSTESLAAHRGRPLVVYFWDPKCEACRQQLSLLTEARRTRPGLDMVGIVLQDNWDEIPPAIEAASVDWPQALDRDGSTAKAFGIAAVPVAFFVRPDGTVNAATFGQMTKWVLLRQLERLAAT
ncbi:MAG: TlpA family protein disulfide reductase [Acidimicrobiia bacterium]